MKDKDPIHSEENIPEKESEKRSLCSFHVIVYPFYLLSFITFVFYSRCWRGGVSYL